MRCEIKRELLSIIQKSLFYVHKGGIYQFHITFTLMSETPAGDIARGIQDQNRYEHIIRLKGQAGTKASV